MKFFLVITALCCAAACQRLTQVEIDRAEYSRFSQVNYTLKDGRTVLCLKYGEPHGGLGLSCDWSHVK